MRKSVRRSTCDSIVACMHLWEALCSGTFLRAFLEVSLGQTGLGWSAVGVNRDGEDEAFKNATETPSQPQPQEGKPESQEITFHLRDTPKSQNSHRRATPVPNLRDADTLCILRGPHLHEPQAHDPCKGRWGLPAARCGDSFSYTWKDNPALMRLLPQASREAFFFFSPDLPLSSLKIV